MPATVQMTLAGGRAEIEATTRSMERLERQSTSTERVLLRYRVLVRRMGLPEPIGSLIDEMGRGTIVARQFTIALQNLYAAYLTGGPLMWALAIAGLGIGVLTTGSMLYRSGRGY